MRIHTGLGSYEEGMFTGSDELVEVPYGTCRTCGKWKWLTPRQVHADCICWDCYDAQVSPKEVNSDQ